MERLRLQEEPKPCSLPYSGLIRRLLTRLPDDNLWSLPTRALLDQEGRTYLPVPPLVDGERLSAIVAAGVAAEGRKSILAAWLLGQGHLLAEHRAEAEWVLAQTLQQRREPDKRSQKQALRKAFRRARSWSILLCILCFLFFAGLFVQHELALDAEIATSEYSQHPGEHHSTTWWETILTSIGEPPYEQSKVDAPRAPTIADAKAESKTLYAVTWLAPSIVFVYSWLGLSLLLWPGIEMRLAADTHRLCAISAFSLGNLRSPRNAGILLKTAVHESNSFVRQAAEAALMQVLPHLTVADYGHLEPHVVPNLCALLHRREPLALAVLEALGKVGDGRALTPVEHVAARAETAQLREAAARIVPVLQERRYQEQSAETLLRAVKTEDPHPEILLRPAVDTSEVIPEQMLRPAPQKEP